MDPEIQKVVEAGTITPAAGERIQQLQPGTYCLHKSWGFGKIAAVNFLLNQITIDFTGKKGHSMQLQYAAESLQPLPADHILSRKASDPAGLKQLATNDPLELVRVVLNSYNGRATQDQIAQALQPEVMNEAEFKRWWDTARKALKKDGHFNVPSKKSDPVELRAAPVARQDDLLAAFFDQRQLKQQLVALDQISRNIEDFSDKKSLEPVLAAAANLARRNQKLHPAHAFEFLVARDEIAEKSGLPKGDDALTLSQLLREEDRRLNDTLPLVAAARQRRIVAEFPAAFGDEWTGKALNLMTRCTSARIVSELARTLQEHGKHEELRRELDRSIRDHSVSTETLMWLCKERHGIFSDLVTPQVFSAIITALERDQFNEIKRGSKLHDMLFDDRDLVNDLLDTAEPSTARDMMRRLLMTPIFEELNKRSLLARVIRVHPELQSMLEGETAEREEALIVSWESLEKRKTEYEDLIKKKIPENTKEIGIARSYGDLRENFEFKAAKEMQRVLMRRKAEMEDQLSRARGTSFENVDTSSVAIGSVVTVRNIATGVVATYTILGAWDGDPALSVISYQAALGQALLGHKVGDEIELQTETGTERCEITSIAPYRDQVPA